MWFKHYALTLSDVKPSSSSGSVNGTGDGASFGGGSGATGAGAGLGGLFAGGMPKLKPAGERRPGGSGGEWLEWNAN